MCPGDGCHLVDVIFYTFLYVSTHRPHYGVGGGGAVYMIDFLFYFFNILIYGK